MQAEQPYHEFVEHNENLPFRTFLSRINTCAPHYHYECEFLFVLKGELQIQCSNGKFTLSEGNLFFVPAKEIHMIEGLTRNNIVNALQIDTEFAKRLDPDFNHRNFSFNELVQRYSDDPSIRKVRQIIAEIAWEMRMRQPAYRLYAQSLVLNLLAIFIRNIPSVIVEESQPHNFENVEEVGGRLARIIAYLDAHSDVEISSAEIAEKEGVSVSYLARLFNQKLGVTYGNYLNNLRAKKSLSRLVRNEETILDIALDCGFASVKTYNIVFKRNYGMTPSQWRKTNMGQEIFSIGESGYGRFDRNFAYSLLKPYLSFSDRIARR